ncbi:MAG: ATP-binding cassette domain-containing protein, partial [Clostridia bacterium]|nr:ATP-binding cassette domain-containing protein [Clostridia bacterium]
GAEILILDEPTAVLTPYEIEELMNIIKNLKQDNKTVIIITHKLKEIKKFSETCTIIRKGKFIDRVDVIGQTEQNLAQKMVGREVKLHVNKTPAKPGKKIFEMQNINVLCDRNLKTVKNLSLELRKGEIYGLAGIEGNGQKELLEAIIGTRKVESGKIIMNNSEIQNTSTRNVLDHKISVIHEDRHKNSCVLSMSVADNMILTKYSKKPFCVNNMLNYEERDKFTEKLIQDYDIRPSNCKNQKIRNLSGGNQQKLIIAREISNDPDLLIAVQPTRGLDVGAIEYVHKILIKLRDQNKAILLISLELDEILDISDRIGVIYDGSIVGEFSQEMANENNIGLLMAGGKTNEAQDN